MALLWTATSDVTSRWVGGEIPATDAQIATLLEDAEDTILREFPDLPDRIDADPALVPNPVPLRRVKKVAARVVIRHLRNPSGVRATQDGAGPYQQTVTYGGEEPGALYLTDEDRRELGGTKTGRAFQIDTTPTTIVPLDPTLWVTADTWGTA